MATDWKKLETKVLETQVFPESVEVKMWPETLLESAKSAATNFVPSAEEATVHCGNGGNPAWNQELPELEQFNKNYSRTK